MRRIHTWILFAFATFAAAAGAQEKAPTADTVITELKAGNQHHASKHRSQMRMGQQESRSEQAGTGEGMNRCGIDAALRRAHCDNAYNSRASACAFVTAG